MPKPNLKNHEFSREFGLGIHVLFLYFFRNNMLKIIILQEKYFLKFLKNHKKSKNRENRENSRAQPAIDAWCFPQCDLADRANATTIDDTITSSLLFLQNNLTSRFEMPRVPKQQHLSTITRISRNSRISRQSNTCLQEAVG